MNKNILIGLALIVAAGAGYYAFGMKPHAAEEAAEAAIEATPAVDDAAAATAAAAKVAADAATKAAADAAAATQAAAEAAARDLADGVWERVAELRNTLNQALSFEGFNTISVGNSAARLPNTLCLIAPHWKGETQVMAMDLAGFAISAGSACSSGKVKASRVLQAMGYDEALASQAIRVSLGPLTTEDEVLRFAEVWLAQYQKARSRAA